MMRRKLCGEPCESCLQTTEKRLQRLLESNASDRPALEEEQAVVSKIDDYPSVQEDFAESARNRAVDATGYKIQKYDSTSMTEPDKISSRGFSISNKMNS